MKGAKKMLIWLMTILTLLVAFAYLASDREQIDEMKEEAKIEERKRQQRMEEYKKRREGLDLNQAKAKAYAKAGIKEKLKYPLSAEISFDSYAISKEGWLQLQFIVKAQNGIGNYITQRYIVNFDGSNFNKDNWEGVGNIQKIFTSNR